MTLGESLRSILSRALGAARSRAYLIAILVVAAILRFYSLASTPSGVWSDELVPFSAAFSVLYHTGPYYSPGLYVPTNLITITLFGEPQDIILFGPTTFAIRASGALYGVGVVFLTYLLSVRLFGHRVGIWSAALAAVDPIAVQASRVFYMDQSNIALFWLLLGSILIYDAIFEPRNRLLRLLGGGTAFGVVIGFYFTDYGKLTAVTALVCLLAYGFFQVKGNQQWSDRLKLIGAPLAIIAVIVVGLPKLGTLFGFSSPIGVLEPSSFYFGANNLLLSGDFGTFTHQYLQYFSPNFLFISGDTNPSQNTGLTGEFLYPSMLFLSVGALVLLFRLFSKSTHKLFPFEFVTLWILVTPIESAAFVYNNYPDSASVIFYIPMIEIVTAIGIVVTIDFVTKLMSHRLDPVQRSQSAYFKGVVSNRSPRWPQGRANKKTRHFNAVTAIVIVAYIVSAGVFVNAYFVVHSDQVVNDPTSQWGMLYGYPELTQFIVTHHLTGLPIYESTDGLFGNSTSYADFFYHTFQVPLSYLNYYSGGLITQLTLTNVSYFYTNQTSLILSGSSQDIKTLRENGVNATVIDNITRPDGALALTLIETRPGLLPPQASALDKTLFNAKPAPQSIYNLSSEVVLNESFSLSARFSIGIPPANNSTTFQNLVEVDYNPGTQLAGIRLAPATLQPGGGPSDVWTINAYIDTTGFLSDELWTSVLVAENESYVVTLTFSDGTAVVFVNNSAVLVTSLVPISYSAGLLEIGSTAVPLLQEAKAWGIGLTAAQVGYEYYNN